MNEKSLSHRLLAISKFIPQGKVVADIGTDHAYLPVYLVKSGRCPLVFACDVKEKPLQAARRNVLANGLSSQIKLRLGDGLSVLQPGEAQVAVIAGMGGNTIVKILEQSPEVLKEIEILVLQPMGDEESLRRWLITNGWCLSDETLVLEDGRLYSIIVCRPGQERLYAAEVLELGPRLIEKKHPLLPLLINKLEEKYSLILQGLSRSNRHEAQKKVKEIKDRLQALKEVAENVGKK